MSTATTILRSQFPYLKYKGTATTCQQRPQIWGPEGGRCTQVWLYFEKSVSYSNNIGDEIILDNYGWKYKPEYLL